MMNKAAAVVALPQPTKPVRKVVRDEEMGEAYENEAQLHQDTRGSRWAGSKKGALPGQRLCISLSLGCLPFATSPREERERGGE